MTQIEKREHNITLITGTSMKIKQGAQQSDACKTVEGQTCYLFNISFGPSIYVEVNFANLDRTSQGKYGCSIVCFEICPHKCIPS